MKNKILTISIIFILLSFIFISNCFAYSGDILINNYTYNLNGLSDQFVILYNTEEDNLYVYLHTKTNHDLCETQRYYLSEDSNNFHLKSRCDHYNDFQVLNIMKYNKDVGGFYTVSTSDRIFSLTFSKSQWKLVDIGCPVYSDENFTTLTDITQYDFFLKPLATTLAEVLAEAKPMERFQTMMSGIIPYLIALVVGLVAFWKAWQLLLKELHKA